MTASEVIDFGEIFGQKKEMQFKEIVEACSPLGYTPKTIQRQLNKAIECRRLKKVRTGIYSPVDMDILDIA